MENRCILVSSVFDLFWHVVFWLKGIKKIHHYTDKLEKGGFLDYYGNSFLIHKHSIGSFLKFSCIVESETVNEVFTVCDIKICWFFFFLEWIYYPFPILQQNILVIWKVHWDKEVIQMLTSSFIANFKHWEAKLSGGYKFSKIIIFAWKLKFIFGSKVLPIFPIKTGSSLYSFSRIKAAKEPRLITVVCLRVFFQVKMIFLGKWLV